MAETNAPVTSPDVLPAALPLMFTYRDMVMGDGFLAEVQAINGRALCVTEPNGEVWMYGVNPGGMAASGVDLESAHAAFRRAFSEVLVDFMLESRSFAEFERTVSAFFEQTNAAFEADWLRAVDVVRAQNVTIGLLPKMSAEAARAIRVASHAVPRAIDNIPQAQAQIAA